MWLWTQRLFLSLANPGEKLIKGNQIFLHGWLQRGMEGGNKGHFFLTTNIPSLPGHVSPSQETLVGRERRASFTWHLSWVCWFSWDPVLIPSVVYWVLTTVDYREDAGCPWMNSTRNFKQTSTMCFRWGSWFIFLRYYSLTSFTSI